MNAINHHKRLGRRTGSTARIFYIQLILLAGIAALGSASLHAAESATWRQFVTAKSKGTEPILPDFSFAGYHAGADAIATIGGPVFDVTKFGAKGDGKADDQTAIQNAINAAEGAGGGVVWFPPGTFRINADLANRRPLLIERSKIILRGSGTNKGGTTILIDEPTMKFATNNSDPNAPQDAGGSEATAEWMIQVKPSTDNHALLAKVTGDTAREAFTLTVDDASKLHPGMWVTLKVVSKEMIPGMIAPYKLANLPPEWTRIRNGIGVQEHHLVKTVEGNQVTLREPVKTAIKASHGWTLAGYTNISEIGIEDICFQGGWLGKFVHHRSYMDDFGWSALKLINTVDSWVRRCSFINFNACLGAESCSYISIQQVVLAGTMGHVSLDDHPRSTGMLYGLMEDRMEHQDELVDTTHGIGAAASAVCTVFWRYTMQLDESCDMHGNFPYATLFDAVTGGNLGSSGGPVASFPNHLRDFVAWNFYQRKAPTKLGNHKKIYDYWCGRPYIVMPIWVGMYGDLIPVNKATLLINESYGRKVEPESLFEAQLALRFGGKAPAWVAQAKTEWSQMNKSLPDFPHSGDNTPWVAAKRAQIIQLILDTPMVKEKTMSKDALRKQWPTKDGKHWVSSRPGLVDADDE